MAVAHSGFPPCFSCTQADLDEVAVAENKTNKQTTLKDSHVSMLFCLRLSPVSTSGRMAKGREEAEEAGTQQGREA